MSLRVIVDGAPMPEADARELWRRFSAYMEEHRGDLAGFAEAEGFASVHPETHGGQPVLVASKTAPQRAYANAAKRPPGGSPAPHAGRPSGGSSRKTRGNRS